MTKGFSYQIRQLALASVALAPAAMLATMPVSTRQPNGSALTWPHGFTAERPELSQWAMHTVESPGFRIRLRIPPAWTVRRPSSSGDLVAIDLTAGYRIEIAATKPSPFNYDQPLSAERLKASIDTMQAAAPKGYVVEKAGQVRDGDRLWMWHESRVLEFGTSASDSFQEMLRVVQYGSARTWSFTATPERQLVRVYCAVLYPRDGSATDIDDRTRKAGAIFRSILEHMDFGAR